VLLCSPHNPTGTLHTAAELTALSTLADAHAVPVVVDEIHGLLAPGGFTPYLRVSETGFVVTSASKAFNLAGLKAGVIVAGPRSQETLERLPMSVHYGASHLGVQAHIAAWRDGAEWLDAVNANITSNVVLLGELLAEHLPAVRWSPPEATYLAWLDCTALGLGDDPAEAFLERGRVALSSGPTFGEGGAGHVRLNLAASSATLREAVLRMASTAASA
jgi:cystathionine beta-lyase